MSTSTKATVMPVKDLQKNILAGVVEAVGNTPLIRLKGPSDATGCEILGKAEFLNPGQSVKDRAALYILRDAFDRGVIGPGGTVVEGTVGNTGIGLCIVGNALGLRTVIVIPETQSEEKKGALRLLGAELIEVPAVPYRDPNNFVKVSERLAAHLARTAEGGALWANQFDNVANRQAHLEGTGPEIWHQTGGRDTPGNGGPDSGEGSGSGNIDGFVCAVGSGGTLGGVSLALKRRNKNIEIAIADPEGAALYAYYTEGVLEAEGTSITEGIGQGRITANLEGIEVDRAYRIPDSEALEILFDLVTNEGLCLGGSSGINIAGAMRLARDLGPGKTVITILCDYGDRYASKLYNPEFLRTRSLPCPAWLARAGHIDIGPVLQ